MYAIKTKRTENNLECMKRIDDQFAIFQQKVKELCMSREDYIEANMSTKNLYFKSILQYEMQKLSVEKPHTFKAFTTLYLRNSEINICNEKIEDMISIKNILSSNFQLQEYCEAVVNTDFDKCKVSKINSIFNDKIKSLAIKNIEYDTKNSKPIVNIENFKEELDLVIKEMDYQVDLEREKILTIENEFLNKDFIKLLNDLTNENNNFDSHNKQSKYSEDIITKSYTDDLIEIDI